MDLKWSNYDFTKIPYQDLVSVGQRTLLYRDIFTVSWLLGRFCNYRCSYCWPYARSKTLDHRPFEVYTRTIDEIKRQARANGFDKFNFTQIFTLNYEGGHPDHDSLAILVNKFAEDHFIKKYFFRVTNYAYLNFSLLGDCLFMINFST